MSPLLPEKKDRFLSSGKGGGGGAKPESPVGPGDSVVSGGDVVVMP